MKLQGGLEPDPPSSEVVIKLLHILSLLFFLPLTRPLFFCIPFIQLNSASHATIWQLSIMPSDKPAVVTDQTDQGHDFRGPGRRLGTNEDAKENTKENSKEDSKEDSKVTKEEVPKNTIEDKSKDQTDEASEGVMVDVDDISDPEIRTHNPPGAPYPPHNAGKSIKKKTVTGLRSEVKTLYEGPRKCVCCVNWVEKPPADAHAAMKSSGEHGDYALLVRRTAHGKDRAWRIQSMMIYSPYIMEMLRTTLDRYPGIALALDQLSIDAPFKAFLHRWDAIVEALQKDDDLKARNHYNLFRQVIEPELKPHLKARDECEEHAVIPYGSMWTIFKPNELVWWEAEGQSNIGRMTEAHYSNDPLGLEFFSLTCEQVEWSGENFGITKTFMNIHSFEGTRPVLSLPVVPVRFKPNTDGLYHQHLSRGRKFEALRGYHFKAYHGPALGVFDDGSGYKRQTRKIVSSQSCLDISSYNMLVPPALDFQLFK